MNILYVGQLSHGGTCLARLEILRKSGAVVAGFDVGAIREKLSRVENSLLSRFNVALPLSSFNRELKQFAETKDFDAVWVDKGVWIYPETLAALKQRATSGLAIHYTPDSQFIDNRSRFFSRSVPAYDVLVTTKPFEVSEYEKRGGRDVVLVLQGYGEQFGRATMLVPDADMMSDVCFIGHCQSHYAQLLEKVAAMPLKLKIWGPGWTRFAKRHGWAKDCVQSDGLWGDDYPRALRSTKIALGLLSKRIPETTTTRTFEIPATGTFMLAERTDDHLALFKDGLEAVFFDDASEMIDNIQIYLADDAARQAIAAAGRARCLSSGYSAENQLRQVFDRLPDCDIG